MVVDTKYMRKEIDKDEPPSFMMDIYWTHGVMDTEHLDQPLGIYKHGPGVSKLC